MAHFLRVANGYSKNVDIRKHEQTSKQQNMPFGQENTRSHASVLSFSDTSDHLEL